MSLDRIDTQDIFIPTTKGDEELKGGSTTLSAAALELLVLFDGRLNLGEIITKSGRDDSATRKVAQRLASEGYLDLSHGLLDSDINFSRFFNTPAPEPTLAAVQGAQAEAGDGAQRLKLDGYYVSIARRAADRTWHPGMPPATVLVVEDDPAMQRLIRFLLENAGFAPKPATNREEILTALRALPSPHAILLDIMLPDTDGFDILARLKQHAALKAIPVIMLTAKATREDVLRGLAGGADGYITKPFDHEVLITGVRAVLGLR